MKMKFATIAAMAEDEADLLEELLWLSPIKINFLSEKLCDNGLSEFLPASSTEEKTDEFYRKIELLEKSVEIYKSLSKNKYSFLKYRHIVTKEDVNSFLSDCSGLFETAEEFIKITEELERLKILEDKLEILKKKMMPWIKLPLRLNEKISANTDYIIGTLPIKKNIETVTECDFTTETGESSETVKAAVWTEELFRDKNFSYLLIMYLNEQKDYLFSALSRLGFNEVNFSDFKGSIKENLLYIENKRQNTTKEREILTEKLEKYVSRYAETEKAIDILNYQIYTNKIREKIAFTKNTFILEFWFPSEFVVTVSELCFKYGAFFEIREPSPYDKPPIKFDTPVFLQIQKNKI